MGKPLEKLFFAFFFRNVNAEDKKKKRTFLGSLEVFLHPNININKFMSTHRLVYVNRRVHLSLTHWGTRKQCPMLTIWYFRHNWVQNKHAYYTLLPNYVFVHLHFELMFIDFNSLIKLRYILLYPISHIISA